MVALRTLEIGDLEERIATLERAIHSKGIELEQPVFAIEQRQLEVGDKEAT